jgi:hypothetical protein|tara:strand:- start:1260 stop:1796 length:537 start_codon:yes stop_codon:yes gene_type:complete
VNRTLALIFILPLTAFALNEWHIQSDGFTSKPDTQPNVATYNSEQQVLPQQPTVNLTAPLNQLSNKAHEFLYKQGRLPEKLSDTAFSEFDLDTLKTLQAGDNLILAVDESRTYTLEISNIIEASNGDRSVFGKVTDDDKTSHQAVMTVTKNTLQGQLNTHTDSYKFVSHGEYGWVTKL